MFLVLSHSPLCLWDDYVPHVLVGWLFFGFDFVVMFFFFWLSVVLRFVCF